MPCAVLPIEILITHDQKEYRIDETKDRRDESPTEEQVQYAHADTSQVELMDSETAQEQGKQSGSQLAFAVWGDCAQVRKREGLPHTTFWADLGLRFNYRATFRTIFFIQTFLNRFIHHFLPTRKFPSNYTNRRRTMI
ncbi:MAG TPA: hypothetical protein VHN12_15590 [Geobacteraceae bacterium]|nr:hypothetical protein [Geobacteraceae bacterium]